MFLVLTAIGLVGLIYLSWVAFAHPHFESQVKKMQVLRTNFLGLEVICAFSFEQVPLPLNIDDTFNSLATVVEFHSFSGKIP